MLNINDVEIKCFIETKNIKQVSIGCRHSLFLSENGQVYGYGSNKHGQLGIKGNHTRCVPVLISGLRDVIAVSAGYDHSLALTFNNRVYGFGANSSGQLGLGDNNNRIAPTLIPSLDGVTQISAGYDHSLALIFNKHVYAFGANYFGQLGIGDRESVYMANKPTLVVNTSPYPVIQISAGNKYSALLTADGNTINYGSKLMHSKL